MRSSAVGRSPFGAARSSCEPARARTAAPTAKYHCTTPLGKACAHGSWLEERSKHHGAADMTALFLNRLGGRLLVRSIRVPAIIERIAADVDELAGAAQGEELAAATVRPDRRAEQRRRADEPDLGFRELCA